MEAQLKQRVVGAAVLVTLGVIFIPLMLDNGGDSGPAVDLDIGSPPPADFSSRVIPIDDATMDRVERAMDVPAGEFGDQAQPSEELPVTEIADPVTAPASESADEVAPEPDMQSAPEPEPSVAEEKPQVPAIPAAAKTPKRPAPARTGVTAWVVQLGSFTTQANADGLVQRLKKAGYTAFIEPLDDDGKPTYRVRVGPELTQLTAERMRDEIAKNVDLKGIVMRYP